MRGWEGRRGQQGEGGGRRGRGEEGGEGGEGTRLLEIQDGEGLKLEWYMWAWQWGVAIHLVELTISGWCGHYNGDIF